MVIMDILSANSDENGPKERIFVFLIFDYNVTKEQKHSYNNI